MSLSRVHISGYIIGAEFYKSGNGNSSSSKNDA